MFCLLPSFDPSHQVSLFLKGKEKNANGLFIGGTTDADSIEEKLRKRRNLAAIATTICIDLNLKIKEIDIRLESHC